MTKPLILIDGSSWLFRAFHALPPLANSRGEPTGAVYGMGAMLKKLLKDYGLAPGEGRIAVVFDPPGKTFRDALYKDYKANRQETPEDLTAQFPHVRKLITALGLPLLVVDHVEADDVIATLAVQAGRQKLPVLIVTADKDMAQLVNERVKLLDTMKNRTLDAAAVQEKFGVPPEKIIDYLALVGDSVDNVPGVPLVGPKTAAKWITEHGTLDAIMQRAADFPGKTGENLRASLGHLPLSRELVTLKCDIELPLKIDDLVPGEPDRATLAALYERMGFKRWLDELGVAPADTAVPAAVPGAGVGAPAPLPPSKATQATIVLDEAAFAQLLKKLEAATRFSLDVETDTPEAMRGRLAGIAFAAEEGQGWYVPLAHDYLGAPKQLDAGTVLARLKPLLQDERKPKVGHNLKYDAIVLARHGIELAGIAHDTMLESYVLDAAGWRHDVDAMAEQHLGHKTLRYEDVAGKGKSQVGFGQVAVERAGAYAAEDADINLRLHAVLQPKIAALAGVRHVFENIEMPLVPVLARVEREGVRVDVELLKRISVELGERMGELQRQAWQEAGSEFNMGSPPQLQHVLYEKLKLPVLGKTPKGQPSTAEDVLEELAGQHPLPRLLLDWRALSKLRSTYADNLPLAVNPQTGRIHTSYNQAVAATGRLSSQDPNLQNIPIRTAEGRRIRQAFVPAEGNTLLAIDYSQIELRLMAHLSGDARLQMAFKAGQDIHQATAAEVFGLALEKVTAGERRAAKAINFGLMYGLSAFGLAKQLSIARETAREYMDNFFARYTGVKAFMDSTREKARSEGFVETMFGRRLYLKDIRSRNQNLRQYAERAAINAPLQGSAADLIKLAMIDVDAFLRKKASDVRMIMQVHDELVLEGPSNTLKALAPELAQRMAGITNLAVPLVTDWGLGPDWDQAHSSQGHASSG